VIAGSPPGTRIAPGRGAAQRRLNPEPTMPISLVRPVLLLLTAATLAACASEKEPASCGSDAQCPASSRCRAGVCVADGRPVAIIRPPLMPVEVFALVELDAADSQDPDHEDAVGDHLWTIRSLTARCAPPEVAGREPLARVRFGCPGRYEVSLAVRDGLGLESAPATIEVDVAPSMRPAVVTAGPDVSTDHTCAGEPRVCRPTDPVALTASTTLAGAALTWSVEPPLDRALEDGTRRVRLVPAAGGASALIESDGTAISGDWIFRVEARDAYGVVGAAYTRISVRNRAPVVMTSPPQEFPHAFDAMRSMFTASGEIPFSVYDPDGDPVEVSATWRHLGDGGAPFTGALTAGSVTFAVQVPFTAPADALRLRGGEDLARTIEIFARDPDRGEGRASVPVAIANRPPAPAAGTVDLQVPHTFDRARSRYVAAAQLGTWTDPDGDPLSATPGVAPCDAISVVDGAVHVECSVQYEGVPAVQKLAGRQPVPVRVRDPWSDASVVAVHTLEILNMPPQLAFTKDLDVLRYTFAGTLAGGFVIDPATFNVSPQVLDPDGDPVLVAGTTAPGGSVSPQVAVCTSPDCVPFHFVQPSVTVPFFFPITSTPLPSRLEASDGSASVANGIAFQFVRY
jgi:hypothetical protein